MPWDVTRDGEWALGALRRVIQEGGASSSAGCRIESGFGGTVVLSQSFARLLLAAIDQRCEAERQATRKQFDL